MRMKVQDHLSIARSKNMQPVLTRPPNKFTAYALKEANLWRTGRKTSDLHDRKLRAECMTQDKIISKTEVTTPIRAEAGAEINKSLCIVCFMREILTIKQRIVLSSLNPKEDDTKAKLAFGIKHT
jgi:hypothetical protein